MIIPRPYQIEALDALWSYYANGNQGNALIAHPTASGKSLLPAIFISEVLKLYPSQRFLLVTHVSTLVEQNAKELLKHWPEVPLGIYSASLGRKDTANSVIYGTIQSMVRNAAAFGHRDMVWVDEAHLIGDSDASQYQAFLGVLKGINQKIKIVGMSATPYRQGMGMLTEGKIFTDVIHDLTSMENFNRLIADGYLAPLIPKRTNSEINVAGVKIQNGDYVGSQLEKASDRITHNAIQESLALGHNRRCWMAFASGIDHAEHIAEALSNQGVECAAIHSKRPKEWNTKALSAWKNLDLQCVSSYSKLTTGINNPYVDFIIDLRPTVSVALHVQKLGRGTRIAEGKTNCLVADFARNVATLGAINDPRIPHKKGNKTGDIPVKLCDACNAYNHISARFCCDCGAEFSFEIKIVPKAGTLEIIKTDNVPPIYEVFEVDRAEYERRQKDDRPAYIRCHYYSGIQKFSENIFPSAKGYGLHLYHQWFMQRNGGTPPQTADGVLQIMSGLRCPKRIRVHVNKQPFQDIVSVEF